jgi:hypothetical protein
MSIGISPGDQILRPARGECLDIVHELVEDRALAGNSVAPPHSRLGGEGSYSVYALSPLIPK